MWDIILQGIGQIILGAAVGAAVGYGVAAIIEGLSRAFAKLWENLVAAAKTIFSYVTEATQHYLAIIAQYLDRNWSDIEYYLRQEFGYRRSEWLLAVFRNGLDTVLAFVDPTQTNRKPAMFSLKPLENHEEVQLPSAQSQPIVAELTV
ncbi:MAG: hypothetical protein F6J93_31605 [Oscillatoria sp. SIO1A7]|nr:hypothetical protein [Oscillatoria sp. SIO1A7]